MQLQVSPQLESFNQGGRKVSSCWAEPFESASIFIEVAPSQLAGSDCIIIVSLIHKSIQTKKSLSRLRDRECARSIGGPPSNFPCGLASQALRLHRCNSSRSPCQLSAKSGSSVVMSDLGARGGVHLEFPISSFFEVRQLSSQVRRKWEEANAIHREGSGELIEACRPGSSAHSKTLVLSPKQNSRLFCHTLNSISIKES